MLLIQILYQQNFCFPKLSWKYQHDILQIYGAISLVFWNVLWQVPIRFYFLKPTSHFVILWDEAADISSINQQLIGYNIVRPGDFLLTRDFLVCFPFFLLKFHNIRLEVYMAVKIVWTLIGGCHPFSKTSVTSRKSAIRELNFNLFSPYPLMFITDNGLARTEFLAAVLMKIQVFLRCYAMSTSNLMTFRNGVVP
jgi:hypothetical protein